MSTFIDTSLQSVSVFLRSQTRADDAGSRKMLISIYRYRMLKYPISKIRES